MNSSFGMKILKVMVIPRKPDSSSPLQNVIGKMEMFERSSIRKTVLRVSISHDYFDVMRGSPCMLCTMKIGVGLAALC